MHISYLNKTVVATVRKNINLQEIQPSFITTEELMHIWTRAWPTSTIVKTDGQVFTINFRCDMDWTVNFCYV